MKKRVRNGTSTRALLLDAAEGMFSALGVSGTSLESIANEINMTRGAVYTHFESKDAMLIALYDRAFKPLDLHIEEFKKERASQADLSSVRSFCLKLIDFPLRDHHCMRVISLLLSGSEMTRRNVMFSRFQHFSESVIDALELALKSAAAKGNISRKLDCYQAALHLHAHITGALSVFMVAKVGLPEKTNIRHILSSSVTASVDALAHIEEFKLGTA